MRRPTLTTLLGLSLMTISTLIFLDAWFIASQKLNAGVAARYDEKISDVEDDTLNESTIFSFPNSSLPILRDLYPGDFLTSSDPCDSDTRLLIVVHSAPDHSDRRQAIRDSWGSEELPIGVELVYLIGESSANNNISDKNQDDIVIGKFEDSYRNLTLKSIAMLHWATINCPNIKFVLKCDDDVYVNVLRLLKEIDKNNIEVENNVIIGHIAAGWKPIRIKNSKYFMSLNEFGGTIFPNFTTGPAYLIHGDLIEPMYNQALLEHWLSLEDVFLTGLVGATKLRARLLNWDTFLNTRATLTVCNIQNLIAIHNVKPKEQPKLHRLTKVSGRSCAMKKQKNKNEQIKK